ncbi:hypothetical protein EGJ86_19360 [Pseudomonas sp. o96-267]|uniref:hypothetical protein n=1 Tax=Pseudomonas sp. o96-267 TaxID=2479853 RepID=UPI000F7734D7|nr:MULTISPECIES: hypothetical protein [Pseudomonas]MDH0959073.1 hypothetical protein [Pseudomonas chengduensis]MDV5863619.1 hypothetical protein [Pseudomonas mendocina]RRV31731.1 hypothetical protein EGJ86_19360 [Pseudomonas sp. o96-267]
MNENTVYAYVDPDGNRRVVAYKSLAGAAKLLDLTPYQLRQYGEVSEKPSEVELALSEPGSVWQRARGSDDWAKLSGAEKLADIPQVGGKRKGAGRHRIADEISTGRSVSLDDDAHAAFIALGGSKYLRKVLAANLDLDDQEWEQLRERGGASFIRQCLRQR